METVIVIAGWAGSALLLVAYALATSGRITPTNRTFQLLNLVGGATLMVNSAYFSAWPSAALNAVWVVIGLIGLLRQGRASQLAAPVHE